MDARGTVLLIDDDDHAGAVARILLERAGYRVLPVGGEDPVAMARAAQPDLVLLDLSTSVKGGAVLSRRLRADPATAHIPIVCFATDLARCIREGMVADEWLAKPAGAEQLYEIVARWATGRAKVCARQPS